MLGLASHHRDPTFINRYCQAATNLVDRVLRLVFKLYYAVFLIKMFSAYSSWEIIWEVVMGILGLYGVLLTSYDSESADLLGRGRSLPDIAGSMKGCQFP